MKWCRTTLAAATAGCLACSPDEPLSPVHSAIAARYTHFTASWEAASPMHAQRWLTASATVDGIVYVFGGQATIGCSGTNTVQAYDPGTNSWSVRASMPTARFSASAAVANGKIYVVGGDVGCGVRTSAVEEYDPATDVWTSKASLPSSRTSLSTSSVNDILYAIGGITGNNTVVRVDAYDPITNRWFSRAPMAVARSEHSSETIGGRIYVIGGGGGLSIATSMEVYDPVTDSWSDGITSPIAFGASGSEVVSGKIHVVGGYWDDRTSHALFDPVVAEWQIETPLPTPRSNFSLQLANGALYAIGGHDFRTNAVTGTVDRLAISAPPRENILPVANAGPDQYLACQGGAATASLDGSASTDIDGTITSYQWSLGTAMFATGVIASRSFALGSHDVTLQVTDNDGGKDFDVTRVLVEDEDPPSIDFVISSPEIWPPNHQMVRVASGIAAMDACDQAVALGVTVVSNEPVNGTGDGDTAPDWNVVTNPDGTFDVFVRAERAGSGTGRIYTITVSALDASSNTSSRSGTVSVPHSRKR